MRGIASDAELNGAIADFLALVSREVTVERVLLFGSYVRGAPHEWSDVDLAIISPDFEGVPSWKRQDRMAILTLDCDRRIAPLWYTSSEYENPGPHSFLGEILRTGRTVYEAGGALRTV